MTRHFLYIFILITLCACSGAKKTASSGSLSSSPGVKQQLLDHNTFRITTYSEDSTYGYTEQNPIKVGGPTDGPLNEARFLNALTGPGGETIQYERLGSCCMFASPNGFMGHGLLDKYSIRSSNHTAPIILYLNMYDSDTLKVPVGFKPKQ